MTPEDSGSPHSLVDLEARIRAHFPRSTEVPPISLRGGNARDEYDLPPPFDPEVDQVSDDYIERFHWGIHHLDPESWLHYLPELLLHALRHETFGTSSAVATFLFSLRPPDRDPPRFGLLSPEQRAVVADVLQVLGFSPESRYQDDALAALEEYWMDAR